MRGPAAPKDPVEKRPGMYIIIDKMIDGRADKDGNVIGHIFMEGRLREQVENMNKGIDEEILNDLESAEGVRRLVHSIGVTIRAEEEASREKTALFDTEFYGKTDKYGTGSHLEMEVPCTGEEMVMQLSDYPENADESVLGAFHLQLPKENETYIITIKFYLNDGYEVPEITVDPPVEFGTEKYNEMIQRSLISSGNNYRLKKVIEKTKAGEDVTIAYIGGSITQGAGAKPINTMCYAYRSFKAFCDMFSPCEGKNVHYVKAGIGGTCSEFGMIRYERDVLADGKITPDLVIVEFAVNDEGDETKGVSFESLVKKILDSANHPAVIINFAVFMNDWNLEDRIVPIGERYEIPMVSVRQAVVPQFGKNTVITKRQFFYDIYHPTNDGHQIMADCLAYLFQVVDQEVIADSDITTDKEVVYGTQFAAVECFDRLNADQYGVVTQTGFDAQDEAVERVERDMDMDVTPVFINNWKKESNRDAKFTLNITCKNLLIVMKDSGDSHFGTAEAYVDGKFVRAMDPLEVGWDHSTALILIDEKESAPHEVVIQMKEGHEEKFFTVQGFGVTR